MIWDLLYWAANILFVAYLIHIGIKIRKSLIERKRRTEEDQAEDHAEGWDEIKPAPVAPKAPPRRIQSVTDITATGNVPPTRTPPKPQAQDPINSGTSIRDYSDHHQPSSHLLAAALVINAAQDPAPDTRSCSSESSGSWGGDSGSSCD